MTPLLRLTTFALALAALATAVTAAAAAGDDKKTKAIGLLFGKESLGKLPSQLQAAQTGKGKGSEWKVVADKTASTGYALAQTAEGPDTLFNLCVVKGTKFADVEVSAKVKAVKGKVDQGGGVVWRYQDENNYYLCRYNPLESNFRVYRVVKGVRKQLGSKEKLTVAEGKWFLVSVTQRGDAIACSLDGTRHLEVKDATFKEAGLFGVWSKADAQSHFDEVKAEAAK
jgi:hypothetical protein